MSIIQFTAILASFTGRVRIPASKAGALGPLLEKSAPPDLTTVQRRRLDAVQREGENVEEVFGRRDDWGGANLQPLRQGLASAFGATDMALEAASMVPASVSNKAARAIKLRAKLLPDGREFTKQGAIPATLYARRVLARIEKRKLAAELKALIGPEYLKGMQRATDDLAEAVGLGESPRQTASANELTDAMAKFTKALQLYTRALAADVDDDDEASRQRFLSAVAPIDEIRVAYSTEDASTEAPSTAPALPANATKPTGGQNGGTSGA